MLDRSGSCAIVTLFVDDVCFTANLGDSRAVMSCDGGKFFIDLPDEKCKASYSGFFYKKSICSSHCYFSRLYFHYQSLCIDVFLIKDFS